MLFHLYSAFLDIAVADFPLRKMFKGPVVANLPLDHLVRISKDGPNINQRIERKINSKLIRDRGFQLVDTESFPAQIIHNTIKFEIPCKGLALRCPSCRR